MDHLANRDCKKLAIVLEQGYSKCLCIVSHNVEKYQNFFYAKNDENFMAGQNWRQMFLATKNDEISKLFQNFFA